MWLSECERGPWWLEWGGWQDPSSSLVPECWLHPPDDHDRGELLHNLENIHYVLLLPQTQLVRHLFILTFPQLWINFRILETRKQIQSREMRMTWTLFGMSFCYIVFVGPIFFVSVLGIADETNLACFILYWFQVKIVFLVKSNFIIENVVMYWLSVQKCPYCK